MVHRHGINAGLDIGEVLLEQRGHVCVEARAVRHRRISMSPRLNIFALALTHRLGKPPQDQAVADIPGHPRQLASSIREPCGDAGNGVVMLLLLEAVRLQIHQSAY